MILVDTSIWIDHLRTADERLARWLGDGQVLAHPFVIGELALGNLHNREVVLQALQDLPQTCVATELEVLRFINEKKLSGVGLGYLDTHLLVAVFLTPGTQLWTRDKRLLAGGTRLGIAASISH